MTAPPPPSSAPAEDGDETQRAPVRGGIGHVIALIRSAVYSVVATTYFLVMTACSFWVAFVPPDKVRQLFRLWASGDMFLLRVLVGQKVKVLGGDNIPGGPALIASKHQSAWETIALIPLVPQGVFILKKELLDIPVYGWFAKYYGMIPVDRSGGSAALKQLSVDAKAALDKGRQVIIFPEGTRQLVGAPPSYKPGAIFLYDRLKVPMVPVAHNSGLLWPRRRFVRYPGTVTVSFLPPIPAGLKRADAQERLKTAIERETDRLVQLGSQ
ncbi:MAG: lysophospholipid acyltransferase family protein [Pseudomonadota bacterium]